MATCAQGLLSGSLQAHVLEGAGLMRIKDALQFNNAENESTQQSSAKV